jgi:non-homologous end joining protein Ku
MDIMDALRQSLERVRKPATSEGGQRRKKDQRRAK